jgi:ankyrin repeat protein
VRGNESIVCFFLSQGVDCDAVDANGNTALHWASLLGYETIAQMLVESGALTNLVNRDN